MLSTCDRSSRIYESQCFKAREFPKVMLQISVGINNKYFFLKKDKFLSHSIILRHIFLPLFLIGNQESCHD